MERFQREFGIEDGRGVLAALFRRREKRGEVQLINGPVLFHFLARLPRSRFGLVLFGGLPSFISFGDQPQSFAQVTGKLDDFLAHVGRHRIEIRR